MDRVLVAGATGHLGQHVVRAFKERGYWVRALARDAGKLALVNQVADDTFVGDITSPATLNGACDNLGIVFSSAGLSVSAKRQKGRGSFHSVDYQGNRNLLNVAVKASVRKFIYVSVFGHNLFGGLEYVKAHEDFVRELRDSGLDYTIVRPTAYFSVFRELYLPSANTRRAIVLGNGSKRINPIHEADLAKVCVDAVSGIQKEIPVGGPRVYTRREIAELAFAALGREPKVASFPTWLAGLLGAIMGPFDPRLSAVFAFGVAASKVDCVAPVAGTRTLEDFYKEVAKER